MSDTGQGYRVSPYLQEIPRANVGNLETVLGAEAKDALERSATDALVLDVMSCTLFQIPPPLKELLETMKRDGSAVTPSPDPLIRFAIEHALLTLPETAVRRHAYQQLEIEINRHCNYRCTFCPVEVSPKPRAFMSQETYALVLDRAREYGTTRTISLNHYSEPTLDPELLQRVELAAKYGIRVDLYTNASLLTRDKITRLSELGNTRLTVNLPSVDRETYERVTGTKLFDRVIQNLKWLHEFGIPTSLCVNTPVEGASAELERINREFFEMFGPTYKWITDSRAGHLDKPDYVRSPSHPGLLNGCWTPMLILNVSHEGKAFLCCQDFNQEVVLGDLREQSIAEIGAGDAAAEIRRYLLGYARPPRSLICTRCSQTRPRTDVLSFAAVPTPVEGALPAMDWTWSPYRRVQLVTYSP